MHQFTKYLFTIIALLLVTISTVTAQDLLARQAPVDRKMRAADSVALRRLIRQEKINYEHSELYDTWNTEKVHCYKDATIPDNYRVDLRGFSMPTPSRVITSNFGYRPAFRRQHKGLDIKVYTGDTIYAAFDGKVRVVDYEAAGYGNYIVIRHANGLETIYGHLSKHLVKTNDVVKSGQPIGLGGNTGRSTGSHLHFETRLLGVAIDPKLMFDFPNQDVTGDYFVYHAERIKHEAAEAKTLAHAEAKPTPQSADESTAKKDTAKDKKQKKATQEETQGKYYKIKKGDSLFAISRTLGLSVRDLCERNNISEHTKLHAGQILRY